MFRVVVAEDEPKIRANIVRKVESADPGCRVVGAASNGVEALRMVSELHPDVVLTDIVMPMMDGLDMIGRIRAEAPDVRVVIVSGYGEFPYARRAMSLGVIDYLLKPLHAAELAATLGKIRAETTREAHTLTEERLFALVGGIGQGLDVFLARIGNECPDPLRIPTSHAELLDAAWRDFPLSRILDRHIPHRFRAWMVRQGSPNEKLLVTWDRTASVDVLPGVARALCEGLKEAAQPYPVTVCYPPGHVAAGKLGSAIEELRICLGRGQRIGCSQVLCTAECPGETLPARIVGSVESEMAVMALRGDAMGVSRAAASLLDSWLVEGCSSAAIERTLISLLATLQSARPAIPEGGTRLIAGEISGVIAAAASTEALRAEIPAIFARAIHGHGGRMEPDKIVELIAQFIEANYARPVRLGSLSEKLGFDESYLTQLFHRLRGTSPIRYLTDLRINRAKELLRERPDMDIQEVGAIVGYPDQHYFCRVFRKHTGTNPTDYRAPGPAAANR